MSDPIETTYPIYNQYIYKDGIGWVLIGGGGGGDSLPDQTNNSGKYLTTNGNTASWSAITPASIGALPTGTTASQIGAIPDTHVVNGITQADIDDWNDSDVFIATYGTTTYADTLAAYNAGKLVVAKNGANYVPLSEYNTTNNTLRFYSWDTDRPHWWNLTSSGWSNGTGTAYVPQNRTINNKALSSNITLVATDVGAISDSAAAAGITSEDIANWNNKIDVDEKVKQTPVNGENATKALLVGSSTETTSTIKSVPNITYNDSSKTLKIAGTSNEKDTIFHGDSIGFRTLSNNRQGKLRTETLTADRTYALQDASGTLAFTSDIPTSLNDLTNDPGFITTPNVAYFTCSTGANTAAKSATLVSGSITSTEVIAGAQILVKFTNSNTASSPTLTLSGITSTASPIKIYGTTAPGTTTDNSWNAGAVIALTYDGTNWIMNDFNNTTYSSMSAEEITAGTGTGDRVITPENLKTAIQTWAMPYNHDAAGITSEDITNWDAKVSDDKTWNGVTLTKDTWTNAAWDTYIPTVASIDGTTATYQRSSTTPGQGRLAKYDSGSYLYSTTPSVSDNSTKVATTAFIKTTLDNNKPNWDANSDEAGYILNRPFYSETVQNGTINIVSPFNYVTIDVDDYTYRYNFPLEDGPDNTFKKDYYEYLKSLYGKGYPGPISLSFNNSGITYTSTSGDVSGSEGHYSSFYYLTDTDATITIDVFYDGNDSYESLAYIVSQQDLNILNSDYVDLTVTLPNYTETIHKLDNKYLDLSNYMQKGVDYVTAGRKSGTTLGNKATVEGNNNTASGDYSHAEGSYTTASAGYAHAEGYHTTANASYASHAEGHYTTASGQWGSHAEGYYAIASGKSSHVEGVYTRATRASQHVVGEYNIADTGGAGPSVRGNYVEIVGNGTADNARNNARTLDWSGNEWLAGKLTLGADPTANMEAATKQYVDSKVSTLGTVLNYKGIKATATALPTTGNTTGDVWIVTADSSEHVWNGTAWEEFGPTIDLSGYATLNSPAFTGTPTAPTPTASSGNTQIATKEYVDTKATITIVDWTTA